MVWLESVGWNQFESSTDGGGCSHLECFCCLCSLVVLYQKTPLYKDVLHKHAIQRADVIAYSSATNALQVLKFRVVQAAFSGLVPASKTSNESPAGVVPHHSCLQELLLHGCNRCNRGLQPRFLICWTSVDLALTT